MHVCPIPCVLLAPIPFTHPETRIVLVEGNYLLLDIEPWARLRGDGLLDEAWFVDVELDEAMARVFRRQTAQGRAPYVVRGRIAGNDRPNAELVDASKGHAQVLVPSGIPFTTPR